MQAIVRGELPAPPIAALIGFQLVEVEEGRVVFELTPGEHQYNPLGSVHGGVASTLLDSAASCAVYTTLPAGTGYTTSQLNVHFVRPITKDTGVLTCEGNVIHAGGRMATAEARMADADGRLYAHGTATCLLIRSRQSP
jgi:uncharacterized protein (TIGR00369 family)